MGDDQIQTILANQAESKARLETLEREMKEIKSDIKAVESNQVAAAVSLTRLEGIPEQIEESKAYVNKLAGACAVIFVILTFTAPIIAAYVDK